jgi:hypothetical protein
MQSRPRTRQSANSNPRAAASRSWRASLIRKRAQVLGEVQAPSRWGPRRVDRRGLARNGDALIGLVR